MKKIFTLALLAIMGMGNASAQELTLDLTTNDNWGLPTDYVKNAATYTNSANGIILSFGESSNGHKINTKDGYVIFGKKDATLTIGAFDFEVERIDIVGREGASGAVMQNIFVGDEAVSTETKGATSTNIYNIAEAYQSAGRFTLKVTSAHNTQITKILIWKKGSGTKQAAGLSWGTNSRTVTIGADDNVFPQLTNENNLTIKYESSDKTVATIDETGAITLIAAGKTDITATFEGNDQFEAATVTYALTVKEASTTPTEVEEITVAKAIELATALADNGYSEVEYQIKGFVVGTPAIDKKSDGTFYGNAKFYMADEKGGTSTIYAYQIFGLNNEKMDSEDYLKEGDEVIVQGKLQKYVRNGEVTLEIAKGGYITSLNGVTTGITTTKTATKQNGAIYNIAGQMVNKGYKGLVIQNGKKFFQK